VRLAALTQPDPGRVRWQRWCPGKESYAITDTANRCLSSVWWRERGGGSLHRDTPIRAGCLFTVVLLRYDAPQGVSVRQELPGRDAQEN
jgi:hypothetical protein